MPRRRSQQVADALAARQQANKNARTRVTFDGVEHHRRADPGRSHDRATRPDVAIDPGKLGVRIDLSVGLNELTRHGLQILEGRAKVIDRRHFPAERMRIARFEYGIRLVRTAHDG